MTLKEVKTIVNKLDIDDSREVNIKLNYQNNSGYHISDIDSYCFMNGNLVFTINPNVKVYLD